MAAAVGAAAKAMLPAIATLPATTAATLLTPTAIARGLGLRLRFGTAAAVRWTSKIAKQLEMKCAG